MKSKILFLILLLMAVSTLDNSLHKVQELNQFCIFEISGQEIKVQIHQDGSALTLDGKGQPIILNSISINEYNQIIRPIKSITIINAPESEVREFEDLHAPITVIDSPNSIIRNNNISSFDTTLYTYGILLNNSPNSEIAYNTIYNITSTSNSVSGVHLVNSSNTIINNNTIEKITSTSSYFNDPRDVYGIRIHDSLDVPIIKAHIKDLSSNGNGYGVFIDSSGMNKINHSYIKEISSRASYGVFVKDSSTMVINDTSISNIVSSSQVAYGISLEDSPHSEMSLNNLFTFDALLGEACGVYLDSCTGTIVGNNTIQSLSSYSSNYGLCISVSDSIEIEWNDISDLISSNSEAYGIFVDEIDSLTVEHNTISDISSSYGLYFLECNHTIISENEVTNVQDWIYIDETSHDVQYSENTVDGQTLMLQSFTRPADLIVEEGDTSNSISWNAVDSFAQSYIIFKNGDFVTSGSWSSGVQIVHNLNYTLPMGQYSYKIVLTENTGNQIID
ncbi:MAG: right-handed parallel beta-helix repeat-containing protein, partial [Candidatus Hodarchaeota archaeon]